MCFFMIQLSRTRNARYIHKFYYIVFCLGLFCVDLLRAKNQHIATDWIHSNTYTNKVIAWRNEWWVSEWEWERSECAQIPSTLYSSNNCYGLEVKRYALMRMAHSVFLSCSQTCAMNVRFRLELAAFQCARWRLVYPFYAVRILDSRFVYEVGNVG